MDTLRKRNLPFIQLIIFLGSFFIISSCGGGGGGGGGGTGGGTGTGTISYNGVKTQASITVANANKFFSVIWNGGPSSAFPSSAIGVASLSPADFQASSSEYLKDSGTVSLFKRLKDRSLSDFTSFTVQSKNIKRATSVDETHYGSVSGTLTITGNIDPNTLTGSLTMTYVNFNDGDGYTYDGPVTFKIDGFDITYGMITDGTMSFTLWTIKSASSNVSLSGSIRVQESLLNNSDSLTVNMDGQDNNTNDTFRFQNFVVAFNYDNILSPTSETSYFSGRVFVGPYGYVDVSTTSPFVYSSYSQENPNSGGPIMLIGAGSSKAAVKPISTSYVKIEVDSDGDAVFESQNYYEWGNLAGAAVTITGTLTQDATKITDTTATLNGTLTNPEGYTTSVWFEYGTTISYGNATIQQTYAAAGVIPVTADITGLMGMTQYHFRLVTQNALGTVYGEDKTFRTYITPQVIASGLNGPIDLAVDATNIYWTEYFGRTVNKTGIGGGPVTTLASEEPFNYPSGIAIDATSVYWSVFASIVINGKINSVPISGGTGTTIATGLSAPGMLKLQAGSLYCVVDGTTIVKVDIASGASTTLVTSTELYSIAGDIAVDSTNVYWTDAYGGAIKKVSVNGGTVITIATGLYQPGPIAIDSGNVYWIDTIGVRKSGINGGTITTLATINAGAEHQDLAVDAGYVYWISKYGGYSYDWSVKKVSISGGEITTLAQGQYNSSYPTPSSIALDSSSIYWIVTGDIYYPPLGYINKIPKSY